MIRYAANVFLSKSALFGRNRQISLSTTLQKNIRWYNTIRKKGFFCYKWLQENFIKDKTCIS